MIITKKSIPRRTVLRGLGAAVALPLLDAMVPALAAVRTTAAKPVNRLSVVYVPNGMNMSQWTPKADGTAYELSPTLEPLRPFRDRVVVVSGLDNKPALALPGEPAAFHGRAGVAFLSGVHPKPTDGADLHAGITLDQIAAATLGQQTQLASLELGLESAELSGSCEPSYSCAYINTLSWRSSTTPLPIENNPRAVFERLFGDGDSTNSAARLARMRNERSLLDSVTHDVARLQRQLGPRDGAKLSEFLEAVRDIERRIQKAEGQSTRELAAAERPAGIPDAFEDHARMMFDLQVLAYQADLTRVITFMLGRELSPRTFPQIGVPDAHHPISHHEDNPEKLAKVAKVDRYLVTQLAYFLEKLRATPDGDGSLLDHLTMIYGAGMGNGNAHDPQNLPILVVGGSGGQLKGGRHLRYPKGTPLMNLHLTLLEKLGVPAESIGDSTGTFNELSAV